MVTLDTSKVSDASASLAETLQEITRVLTMLKTLAGVAPDRQPIVNLLAQIAHFTAHIVAAPLNSLDQCAPTPPTKQHIV
eukprot:m.251357 g.251357  ORF g.251357 m.251357 type:complete len:80 (-) comp17189_c0_seq1:22-261(-)